MNAEIAPAYIICSRKVRQTMVVGFALAWEFLKFLALRLSAALPR